MRDVTNLSFCIQDFRVQCVIQWLPDLAQYLFNRSQPESCLLSSNKESILTNTLCNIHNMCKLKTIVCLSNSQIFRPSFRIVVSILYFPFMIRASLSKIHFNEIHHCYLPSNCLSLAMTDSSNLIMYVVPLCQWQVTLAGCKLKIIDVVVIIRRIWTICHLQNCWCWEFPQLFQHWRLHSSGYLYLWVLKWICWPEIPSQSGNMFYHHHWHVPICLLLCQTMTRNTIHILKLPEHLHNKALLSKLWIWWRWVSAAVWSPSYNSSLEQPKGLAFACPLAAPIQKALR